MAPGTFLAGGRAVCARRAWAAVYRLRRWRLGRLIRGLALAVALLIAVVSILFVADRIQDLVVGLIGRVGAAWALGIVGVATILLWIVWVRYGGVHALRRWGVVLKPAVVHEQDEGGAASAGGPPVEKPSQDPQALR